MQNYELQRQKSINEKQKGIKRSDTYDSQKSVPAALKYQKQPSYSQS